MAKLSARRQPSTTFRRFNQSSLSPCFPPYSAAMTIPSTTPYLHLCSNADVLCAYGVCTACIPSHVSAGEVAAADQEAFGYASQVNCLGAASHCPIFSWLTCVLPVDSIVGRCGISVCLFFSLPGVARKRDRESSAKIIHGESKANGMTVNVARIFTFIPVMTLVISSTPMPPPALARHYHGFLGS